MHCDTTLQYHLVWQHEHTTSLTLRITYVICRSPRLKPCLCLTLIVLQLVNQPRHAPGIQSAHLAQTAHRHGPTDKHSRLIFYLLLKLTDSNTSLTTHSVLSKLAGDIQAPSHQSPAPSQLSYQILHVALLQSAVTMTNHPQTASDNHPQTTSANLSLTLCSAYPMCTLCTSSTAQYQ